MPQDRTDHSSSFEISFLVLTYHSDWEALRATLVSALMQREVALEIVVADDGSGDFPAERTEALFREHGFTDYRLVIGEENRGTIANYIAGLKACRAEYVKDIAPGDFLSGSLVLKEWLARLRESGADWSFADMQYYTTEGGTMKPLPTPPFPVWLSPYLRGKDRKARWNYAVLDDSAHGAAMMGRTEVLLRYAEELAVAGNRYCEDYLFRVMMFDGRCPVYFADTAVYYEFGTGISSGKSDVWKKRIYDEFFRMSRMLLDRKPRDAFQARMQKWIRRKTSPLAMVLIPGKLWRWVLFQVIRRKPRRDFDQTEEWRKLCR